MSKNKVLSHYCTGCGLCKSIHEADLSIDRKGFSHPESFQPSILKKICPSYGKQMKDMSGEIWGRQLKVYYGWSTDQHVRLQASSGGVITAVCLYLLDHGLVDGIVQVEADPVTPFETNAVVSYTREGIIKRSGSRYSISSPLEILAQLDREKKYCLVGKPCDIDAWKNYISVNTSESVLFPYLLSFFCMGVPSRDAQIKLVEHMGCAAEQCAALRYRGDGWPGKTVAEDRSGHTYSTDYDTSWGTILGRDLMPACRVCANGVGETADIACGDAWYLKDGKPSFTEADGRNVVFARTEKGMKLLEAVRNASYLVLQDFNDFETLLPKMQYAQYERRTTLLSRIIALKLLAKPAPHYRLRMLAGYSRYAPVRSKIRFFKGTLKRALRGIY